MNAPTRPSKLHRQLAASLALDVDPAIRLLDAYREVHGRFDDGEAEAAIAAATEGRPAFWTTVTDGYNQVAGLFLSVVNRSGLDAAIAHCRQDRMTGYRRSVLFNLSVLIPLNEPARKALKLAQREEWCRSPMAAEHERLSPVEG